MIWNPFPDKRPPKEGRYLVAFPTRESPFWDFEMCRWSQYSGWMGLPSSAIKQIQYWTIVEHPKESDF